jgi:hypothetical protein
LPKRLAVALVHHPVYNKPGQVVATSLTNLDIHDIARAARTFGVAPYFIVHAIPEMQEFAGEVIAHWTKGFGAEYNITRKEALEMIQVVPDLSAVDRELTRLWGEAPEFVVTSARRFPFTTTYTELRRRIDADEKGICLLFGTGYGLVDEIMVESDGILEPVCGPTAWNHLSVRSAVSIILDRLCAVSPEGGQSTGPDRTDS